MATRPASNGNDKTQESKMTDEKKDQPTSGYREENLKPSQGKPKVPGEGHPKESQNNPDQKPGKQGS